MKKLIRIFLALLVLNACQIEPQNQNKELNTIVCTTGMLGDAVKNLVGDKVQVITLMGPGVDPHLYKATQGDLKSLTNADVIVYNGLHLEGKMGEIFEKLQNQKKIIVAAEGIAEEKLINNTEFQGAYDPHLWFDVQLWAEVVDHVAKELGDFSDTLKPFIEQNKLSYLKKLESLNQEVFIKLEVLPKNQRVLITAHDAFGYFGKAYQFTVRGLQGISTTSEYGLKDVSDLVNYIVENQIKAVFVESSVSDKALKTVIEGCIEKGHQVKIGGNLYSDAMGPTNSVEGTYIGMVNYNVNTIIEGLK